MNKKEAIESFVSRLHYLHDSSYGDFKRKADQAMTRMWEVLGHENKEVDEVLYACKKDLVYGPHQDIEDARFKLLQMTDKLNKLVA